MDKMRFLNKIVNIILLLFLFLFLTFMCDTGVSKLGKGFVYYHEIKAIFGKTDIPPTVLSFDYNRNYIIVKQKPKESNCGLYNPVEYVYPLGYDTTYYWLIIKKDQKVIGPLIYDDFLKMKTKYKVSNKLQLE